MNSGVEPLVYGIESNFYDTNQNYIGMRLTTLKYSLIGPEYWVRFKYTNTTFKVEKSSVDEFLQKSEVNDMKKKHSLTN